jgi:type VI secretion system protein
VRSNRLPRVFLGFCLLPWAVILITIAGCSSISEIVGGVFQSGPKASEVKWEGVVVATGPDANLNSAIGVDIVLVKELALVDALSNLDAKKWFSNRFDLKRTFPEGLVIVSMELVPQQTVNVRRSEFAKGPVFGAFVFANYSEAGEHRQRLLPNKFGYYVALGPKAFSVVESRAAPTE